MPAKNVAILHNEDGQNSVETAVGKPNALDTNSSKRLVRISQCKRMKASLTSGSDTLMQLMTQNGPLPVMTPKQVSTSPSQDDLRRNSSPGTSAVWSSQRHKDVELDQELGQIVQNQAASGMEWVQSGCQSLQHGIDQANLGQWDIRNGFDAAFDDGLSMLDNMSPVRPVYDRDTITRVSEDQSQHIYRASQTQYVPEPTLPLPNPPAAMLGSANAQTCRNKTHSMSESKFLIDQLLDFPIQLIGKC